MEDAYRNTEQRANGEARLLLYEKVLSVGSDLVAPWRDNAALGDPSFASFIDEDLAFVERFCSLPDDEAMRQAAHTFVDDGRFTPSGSPRDSQLMTAGFFWLAGRHVRAGASYFEGSVDVRCLGKH